MRKSERTRQRIVDAALALFRKRGYEKTTMALVAKRAGVSKGNAYYYFRSKEELIQGFYDELQARHRAVVEERLAGVDDVERRLHIALHAWQDVAAPYHAFADKLFRSAANPTSPLSPFSPESARARESSIAIFRDVVAGDDDTAQALWLLHMALVLFWVFDRSPEQEKTRAAIDKVVPLVAGFLPMLPMVAPVLHDVLDGLLAAPAPGTPPLQRRK